MAVWNTKQLTVGFGFMMILLNVYYVDDICIGDLRICSCIIAYTCAARSLPCISWLPFIFCLLSFITLFRVDTCDIWMWFSMARNENVLTCMFFLVTVMNEETSHMWISSIFHRLNILNWFFVLLSFVQADKSDGKTSSRLPYFSSFEQPNWVFVAEGIVWLIPLDAAKRSVGLMNSCSLQCEISSNLRLWHFVANRSCWSRWGWFHYSSAWNTRGSRLLRWWSKHTQGSVENTQLPGER